MSTKRAKRGRGPAADNRASEPDNSHDRTLLDAGNGREIQAERSANLSSYIIEGVDRGVLSAQSIKVGAQESVEFSAELVGSLMEEEDRNRKAAILSVAWFDKDNQPLTAVQRGFANSPKYGFFQYVPFEQESGHDSFAVTLTAPEGADRLSASLIRFSNFSLTLVSSKISRLGRGK